MATIHSHNNEWENAQIIGTGRDTLIGEDDTLLVIQSELNGVLDFYAEDEDGKHYNVGNSAFWLTED